MWVIMKDNGQPVGWPKALTFKTKKEAKIRLQKINHQARGVFGELKIEEISQDRLHRLSQNQ
jgi:hypothetical protein